MNDDAQQTHKGLLHDEEVTFTPTRPSDTTTAPIVVRRRADARGAAVANAVAMAVVAIAALLVTVRVAIHSVSGFVHDQRLMDSLGGTTEAWNSIVGVLEKVTIASVALCLAVCVVIAVVQRRWAIALGAAVMVVGANITTQVLKYDVLHSVVGTNSLPSGHTTVGLSLALAAMLVSPRAWRPLVTAGAAFLATFIGAGTVAAHWHRPGDVVAAATICLGWAAVAVLIGSLLGRRAPGGRARPVIAFGAIVGVVAAGVCFVLIGVRPALGISDVFTAAGALGLLGAVMAIVVGWVALAADKSLG